MFCIECGTKLDIGQKFCKNCGSPIKVSIEKKETIKALNTKTDSKDVTKQSGKKNSILYVFGYTFIYILIAASKVGFRIDGFAYAVGYTILPFIILLTSTGIPRKGLRKVVMFFFSAIFFIMVLNIEDPYS